MDVNVQIGGENARIRIKGRFEFAARRAFRDALDRALASAAREIAIDLSGAEYLDSAALGMLLVARDRATEAKKQLILQSRSGPVRDVLEIANFHKHFAMA